MLQFAGYPQSTGTHELENAEIQYNVLPHLTSDSSPRKTADKSPEHAIREAYVAYTTCNVDA